MDDSSNKNEADPAEKVSTDPADELSESGGPADGSGNSSGAEKDAPLKEVVLYAVGNLENAMSNQFYNLLNVLMIVALGMNPVLLGLILAIKTLWDGITDPVMANITDRARTRWGRRRPFILVGGVGRMMLFVAIFVFFPRDDSIKSNADYAVEMEQKKVEQVAAESSPDPESADAGGEQKEVAKAEPEAAPVVKKKLGMIEKIKEGYRAFMDADNSYHQRVTIYLLVACLLFTTLTTVNSVPYYALGIELCPSYDGRTRVVTYRGLVDNVMGMLGQWVMPFCFLPIFFNVIDGLLTYSIILAALGIPSTVIMVMFIKERLGTTLPVQERGPGLFKSIWLTAKNIHFLKIFALYQLIGLTNGVFAQIGVLLTIYWVFQGDALAGSVLSGYVSIIATVLALLTLPLVNWSCRKLQKHRTMRIAVLWMSLGAALKWVLLTPDHPYWQLALPFFFSIGISGVYTILPTMMADVTDMDELANGTRREGMFGAVMAFLTKVTGASQPLLAGVVLVLAGFDASLGANQEPDTIFRMRLMFSIIPATLLLLALIVLWRYPLTREYMDEVKAELKLRRAAKLAKQEANDDGIDGVRESS